MDVSITALSAADAAAVTDLDTFSFVQDPDAHPPEAVTEPLDWDHTFGARTAATGAHLAGVYSWFDLTLTVPAATGPGAPAKAPATTTAPLAGLTWVGVHPDARRRGVLSTMIGHHLADVRDRGYAIAGLTASEPGIYGRFGYGVATLDVEYRLPRAPRLPGPDTALGTAADAVRTSLLYRVDDAATLARFRAVDAAGGSGRAGFLRFPERNDRVGLRDTPATRIGREPTRAFVATRDGVDVGYALFVREARERHGSEGVVRVRVLHAHDDAALLALVRRLSDVDLTGGAVLRGRSLDDAPIGWAGGPRDLRLTGDDGLWLRPVDVAAMLAARGYAAPVDVVLDVLDPTCPWNEGRWRLSVDERGEAVCAATTDPAHVRLGAAGIGPWFLGLRGAAAPLLTSIAPAAGGVEELRPGALRALARAAATASQPLGGRGF